MLARGMPFGRLRWLDSINNWSLDFRRLRPERFTCTANWHVDEPQLVVVACQIGCPLDGAELASRLAALPDQDPYWVCQGHDLVRLLVIGLRRVLGDLKTSLGHDHVAALLRQSMEHSELLSTQSSVDIRAWERSNPPYRVLR